MIPLSAPKFSGKEWLFLKRCLDSSWVSSSGRIVNDFERAVCRKFKARHAVACVNGTASLFIALKLSGVMAQDEVIVPTVTFIAPINAVRYLGAEPVFMDCDEFLNLDGEKLADFCRRECRLTKDGLRNKLTGKIIKAVIAVHIFGSPCGLERIKTICRQYRLKLIEDAAESIGAYYTAGKYKGRFTGTIGDFGVYSFNGNKIITAGGGGMILTGKKESAEQAFYLTNQAKDDPLRHIHHQVGFNFRLSSLQSALGLAQLSYLDECIRIKKENYALYKKLLSGIPGLGFLGNPEGTSPNYWFYSLLVERSEFGLDRDRLIAKLLKRQIQVRPLWLPNHLQRPYRKNQAYRIERALWFWKRVINLPCSLALTKNQMRQVCLAIKGSRRD